MEKSANHVDRAFEHGHAREYKVYIGSEELCNMDPESIGMRKKTHFVEKPLCISHLPADKEICPPIWFEENTDVVTKGSMAHPHSKEKSMALGART